jgi:hypothetical protein
MSIAVRDAQQRARTRAAVELTALVRESVSADAPREVLHLHLAGLAPALRRPHHRRLLRDALDAALSATRANIFDLPNGDVVAVARVPAPAIEEAQAALIGALDAGSIAAVRRLRLPDEAAQLLSTAAESLGMEPAEPSAPTVVPRVPLGSADLDAAERALAVADLEPMTIAQSVCRLDPEDDAPATAWEDRRIAWSALSAVLLPGRDPDAAPALRRRLSRVAEARMLVELARPANQPGWKPVGLPLSPATLDADVFARFAEALPAGRRADVTVGLRAADILVEPRAVVRLAPTLRQRGFRLALDDVTPGMIALLPPERLGFDIVRLRWAADLPSAMPDSVRVLLMAAADRVVLTNVDRPAAIAWGWEAGIRLFQGPLIERRRRGV